ERNGPSLVAVGKAEEDLEEAIESGRARVGMSDPLGIATDVCAGGESVFNFTCTAVHRVVSHVDAREAISVPVQEANEPEDILKLVAPWESNLLGRPTLDAGSLNGNGVDFFVYF